MKTVLLFKIRKNEKEGKKWRNNKTNKMYKVHSNKLILLKRIFASQSVIEEQISDTVAEGTIDVKLGKESQEKA